ncbi:hypothetical protein F7018_17940, partial [Tenacibaculum aiptasiae]
LSIIEHEVPYLVSKFDLELNVLDQDSIRLSITYRKDLFEASSIARFSGYLEQMIDEVLNDKNILIRDIDILSD